MESETYEHKSRIEWSEAGKQLDLLKTIVAFANCEGGTVKIDEFVGDERRMDSARLDDFVGKYVDPPVRGISSEKDGSGGWLIVVSKSAFAPHVVVEAGNYKIEGRQKPAFYPGQVYVRHSSKSEPADSQDFQRMIREGVSSWLSSLGDAVSQLGYLPDASGSGIPMRIVDGGPALSIALSESHPYSATDLGMPFGKTGAWIGKMINVESMRNDMRFTKKLGIYSSPVSCFSEAAKKRVAEILTSNPDYNPYTNDTQD